MIIDHPNKNHQATVNNAEMTRQVAVAAAIAAGGNSVQKQYPNCRGRILQGAVIASCIANGVPGEATFRQSLHDLTGQST